MNLPVVDFNYKADKHNTRYTGLLAQQLKAVISELVAESDGSYGIDYIKMVPYLLKALQDLQQDMDNTKKLVSNSQAALENTKLQLQQLQQQLAEQQAAIRGMKAGGK